MARPIAVTSVDELSYIVQGSKLCLVVEASSIKVGVVLVSSFNGISPFRGI